MWLHQICQYLKNKFYEKNFLKNKILLKLNEGKSQWQMR